jgi:hypothetical protein
MHGLSLFGRLEQSGGKKNGVTPSGMFFKKPAQHHSPDQELPTQFSKLSLLE